MLFFGQHIEIFFGSSVLALESKSLLVLSTTADHAGRELKGGRERGREREGGGGRGRGGRGGEGERRDIKSYFFKRIVPNVTLS